MGHGSGGFTRHDSHGNAAGLAQDRRCRRWRAEVQRRIHGFVPGTARRTLEFRKRDLRRPLHRQRTRSAAPASAGFSTPRLATARSAAALSARQPAPNSFRVQYKSGKETQTTAIRFVGGNVAKTVNVPPLRKRNNWVALKAADLRSVSDPISATLIRADGPGDVCNRTLRVYDGQMRVNLQLSYVSKGPVSGYDGEAVTCSAKFVPVSGYRSNNRSVSYLRDRAKISVSFAPLGETGVYAPVRASVSTTIGTVTVNARRTKS